MHTPSKPRLIWARDAAEPRRAPAGGYMPAQAEIIDIRTRRNWRRPEAPAWLFLIDMAFTFLMVLLGCWLFNKMRGG